MKQNRKKVTSGAPWEAVVGYSRAIRAGDRIEVSGTVSMRNGEVHAPNDPAGQTRHILGIIRKALEELGASMDDVIRTRIFVTDVNDWEAVGREHGAIFANIRPACSMVGVKELIKPGLVVEIEASAVVREMP